VLSVYGEVQKKEKDKSGAIPLAGYDSRFATSGIGMPFVS